jgi:hypothetical protein
VEDANEVEDVEYVKLDSSLSSSVTGEGKEERRGGWRRGVGGAPDTNRSVLVEFGNNSIFSGIKLYNDTIGLGRQRRAMPVEANRGRIR